MSKHAKKDTVLLKGYREGLDEVTKTRYDQKCQIINGVDPYNCTLTWSKDEKVLPSVLYPDICNYLIYSPGRYTTDDLKAWRSMDAVNQLQNGWVSDRASITFNESVLVTAKVMHSQRLREKPLQPWVITEPEGPIKAAHCNCMAGLGEACTHIAVLLWSIYTTVGIRDSATVTESKAYWMMPTARKTVRYKEVSDINFTSTKSAKKQLVDMIQGNSATTPRTPVTRKKVPRATQDDFDKLCDKINTLSVKPALLALIPKYANDFRPKMDTKNFPKPLGDLKDKEYINASVDKVKEVCKGIQVQCSLDQAKNVESETRSQFKNPLWNKFRAGRITASNAKPVCSTKSDLPAPSLIKGICYPDSVVFETKATRYGIDNEKKARDEFIDVMSERHENLLVEDSGFHISTDYPFIGASPDGVATCDCCGTACIEIKCPYTARERDVNQDTVDCLCVKDGLVQLNTSHRYYYQVQTQLGVTGNDFAYFVVWSPNRIHIEQIDFDPAVWGEICTKSRLVFYSGILPELVGKIYTRLPISSHTADSVSDTNIVDNSAKRTTTTDITDSASTSSDRSDSIPIPSKENSNTSQNAASCSSAEPVIAQKENKGKQPKSSTKRTSVKRSVLKAIDNRPKENQPKSDQNDDEILYCVCEQVEFGRMVACDNVACPGEWFHYGCVNLENAPEGKWYCPDCRKLPAFKRKRSSRN